MKKSIKIVFILMALLITCTLFACNHSIYSLQESSAGLSLATDESITYTISLYERENDTTSFCRDYKYEYQSGDGEISVYTVMLHLGYSVDGYNYHYYYYDETADTKIGELITDLNMTLNSNISIVRVKGEKHSYTIEYQDEIGNVINQTESFDVDSIPSLYTGYSITDEDSRFRVNSTNRWCVFDYKVLDYVPISSLDKEYLGNNEKIILRANVEQYKYRITYYDEDKNELKYQDYSIDDASIELYNGYSPTKSNFKFVCWLSGGDEVSSIDPTSARNYDLVASVKQYIFKIQYYSRTGALQDNLTRNINIDTIGDNISVSTPSVDEYVDSELTQLAENTSLPKTDYAAYWTTEIGNYSKRVSSYNNADIKGDIDLYLLIEKDVYNIRFYNRQGELIESLNTTYRKSTDIAREFKNTETCSENGYVFNGWLDEKGDEVTQIDPSLSRDLEFYANMERTYLFIIYNKEDNTDSVAGEGTIEKIKQAMLAHFNENKEGYEKRVLFGENRLIIDETINYSLVNETIATKPIDDLINLEFTYCLKSYRIQYILDDGEWGDNRGLTSYTITTTEYSLPNPIKYGYKFTGWTYSGQEEPKLNVVIPNGSTGDRSYTANWEAKEVTVYNNVNTQTIKVTFDGKYENLFADPQIPGYEFKGWKIEGASDGDFITIDSICKIAEDHKLFPVIVEKEYTLTYFYFSGKDNETEKVKYKSEFTLKEDAQREGYTFEGWMYNGEILSKETTKWYYTEDIIVSAKWTPNVYKVTIKGGSKDVIIDAIYDAPLNLADSLEEENEVVLGFYSKDNGEGEKIADKNGVINAYKTVGNSTYYAFYAIFGNSFVNTVSINGEALKDAKYSLAIDGITFTTKKDFTAIGYHSVSIVDGDKNEIVSKKIFIKEDLGIENNKHYTEPPVLNHADADIYIDGDLVEDFYSYKITTNGQHTIKLVGAGGYEVEYTVYFDNPHYTLFWYVLGGSGILLCCAIIFVLIGRKNVIYYDYDRK